MSTYAVTATCNRCHHSSASPYHDLTCPVCHSTDVDTSDLAAHDPEYGFGDNNSLGTRRIKGDG